MSVVLVLLDDELLPDDSTSSIRDGIDRLIIESLLRRLVLLLSTRDVVSFS